MVDVVCTKWIAQWVDIRWESHVWWMNQGRNGNPDIQHVQSSWLRMMSRVGGGAACVAPQSAPQPPLIMIR